MKGPPSHGNENTLVTYLSILKHHGLILRLVNGLRRSRYPRVFALLKLILLLAELNDKSVETWTKNMHPFCSVRLIQAPGCSKAG